MHKKDIIFQYTMTSLIIFDLFCNFETTKIREKLIELLSRVALWSFFAKLHCLLLLSLGLLVCCSSHFSVMQDYKARQSHLARLSAIHEHLLPSLHQTAGRIIQHLQRSLSVCTCVFVCVWGLPMQGDWDDHINRSLTNYNGRVVISSCHEITLQNN